MPVRQTAGSASSAPRRPASSPSAAAAASAKIAGFWRGARPAVEIATTCSTSHAVRSRAARRTTGAFCAVSSRAVA